MFYINGLGPNGQSMPIALRHGLFSGSKHSWLIHIIPHMYILIREYVVLLFPVSISLPLRPVEQLEVVPALLVEEVHPH